MLFVDFDKSLPEAGPIVAREGERGRTVSATLLDMGEPADLSGAVATFRAMWPGGSAESPCSVEGCAASWPMPAFPRGVSRATAYIEAVFDGTTAATQDIAVTIKEGA